MDNPAKERPVLELEWTAIHQVALHLMQTHKVVEVGMGVQVVAAAVAAAGLQLQVVAERRIPVIQRSVWVAEPLEVPNCPPRYGVAEVAAGGVVMILDQENPKLRQLGGLADGVGLVEDWYILLQTA